MVAFLDWGVALVPEHALENPSSEPPKWPFCQPMLRVAARSKQLSGGFFVAYPKVVVLLAQEQKLIGEQIEYASQSVRRRGWESLWPLAVLSDLHGRSGGIVTLIRQHLGCGHCDHTTDIPGRAVSCFVEGEGLKRANIATLYLEVGMEASPSNRHIVSLVGSGLCIMASEIYIFGADFQCDPGIWHQAGATGSSE